MFRLLKLALLVGGGYTLYEFLQGLHGSGGGMERQPQQRQGGQRRGGEREMSRSHPQNMTGPGQGRRVQVDMGEDLGGHTESVGRGVVR